VRSVADRTGASCAPSPHRLAQKGPSMTTTSPPPPATAEQPTTPALQADGVTKRFAGVTALSGVSFSVQPGSIHALVGENGAGKSTLIKVLTGVHRPDEGRLLHHGAETSFEDKK